MIGNNTLKRSLNLFFGLAILMVASGSTNQTIGGFLEPVAMATNADDAAAAVAAAEKALADANALPTTGEKAKRDAAVTAATVYKSSAEEWAKAPDDADKKAAVATTASMAKSTLEAAAIPCTIGEQGCCEQGSAAPEAEKTKDVEPKTSVNEKPTSG